MAREKTLARKEERERGLLEPWDTFSEMERMFRDFVIPPTTWFRPPGWLTGLRTEFTPQVDLKETEKEYILSAALPGMEKDDIEINVTSDRITISGERKTEEERPEEAYHLKQQTHGSFRVSYALPGEVKPHEVKATHKNGILEVIMPKTVEVEAAHKVPIEG